MKWPTVLPSWQYCPSNVEFASERIIPANDSTMFPVKHRDKHYRRWRKYAAIMEARKAMRA